MKRCVLRGLRSKFLYEISIRNKGIRASIDPLWLVMSRTNAANHTPSYALSYYCGSAPPAFLTSWICGENRHISKLNWLSSPDPV
ncbi:hypothetical protein J1N35_023583 [Gossypium stocksii]|uniref:Uncharacterized protein n=1 Tax=Gossypium stocksii TaxID=47602 RepID=A0A9D3VK61_9ROSI|nr:hypothetical protein J1N35_023583 [Gossypium stocksii]